MTRGVGDCRSEEEGYKRREGVGVCRRSVIFFG